MDNYRVWTWGHRVPRRPETLTVLPLPPPHLLSTPSQAGGVGLQTTAIANNEIRLVVALLRVLS